VPDVIPGFLEELKAFSSPALVCRWCFLHDPAKSNHGKWTPPHLFMPAVGGKRAAGKPANQGA
jgi:hypothetical protein